MDPIFAKLKCDDTNKSKNVIFTHPEMNFALILSTTAYYFIHAEVTSSLLAQWLDGDKVKRKQNRFVFANAYRAKK